MILITSIAPVHYTDTQWQAVTSWITAGYEVVSLNCIEEVEILRSQYPQVNFFSTTKVLTAIFGKPYVSIKAVFEFAEEQDYDCFMIINSDILIVDSGGKLKELEMKAEKGIIAMNRWNFTDGIDNAKVYNLGMDAFIVHKKYYGLLGAPNFHNGVYCFGQCFWDFIVPMQALRKGIPVMNPQYKILLHRDHPVQYSMDAWRYLAHVFQADLNFQPNLKKAEQINSVAYRDLQHGFNKSKHLL